MAEEEIQITDALQKELLDLHQNHHEQFKHRVRTIFRENPRTFKFLDIGRADENGNSGIDEEEFLEYTAVFSSELGKKIFYTIKEDRGKQDELTYVDIQSFIHNKKKHHQHLSVHDTKWVFDKLKSIDLSSIGANHDNKINKNEFTAYFKEYNILPEILDKIFYLLDDNHDGTVTIKEFYKFKDKLTKHQFDQLLSDNLSSSPESTPTPVPVQKQQPNVEEAKIEEPKKEEPKKEEPKKEEPKKEEPKIEPKIEEPKKEEPKKEEPKIEQPKIEQPKIEQPKKEQPKKEEPKKEEPKKEEPKKEEPKKEEPKKEEPKKEEPKKEEPKAQTYQSVGPIVPIITNNESQKQVKFEEKKIQPSPPSKDEEEEIESDEEEETDKPGVMPATKTATTALKDNKRDSLASGAQESLKLLEAKRKQSEDLQALKKNPDAHDQNKDKQATQKTSETSNNNKIIAPTVQAQPSNTLNPSGEGPKRVWVKSKTTSKWRECTIEEEKSDEILVHFISYHNKYNEWIKKSELGDRWVETLPSTELDIGDNVSAYLDHLKMWVEAEIKDVNVEKNEVNIVYIGISTDEWLSATSSRISKEHKAANDPFIDEPTNYTIKPQPLSDDKTIETIQNKQAAPDCCKIL